MPTTQVSAPIKNAKHSKQQKPFARTIDNYQVNTFACFRWLTLAIKDFAHAP